MRLTAIRATDIQPIREFYADNLGAVVIIAGANGSGKSRLKNRIVNQFKDPSQPQVELTLEATRPEEITDWGASEITLTRGQDTANFQHFMKGSTKGRSHLGGVIQIESNRSVGAVSFKQLNLGTPDPDDVDLANTFFLQPLSSRWSETVNSIYHKVANRDQKIAQFTKDNPHATCAEPVAKFPDPFVAYQRAFTSLLPGKELEPIDAKHLKEFHFRIAGSGPIAFGALSSGEQEVVRIVFGLMLKDIRHSVILVDEPELHLHPTLAFRMIETLRQMGGGTNQFIFFTHSADLISTYYSSGSVFFIDQNKDSGNQASRLSDISSEHTETAQAIGSNLGMFAVGRRLIFVEGDDSSVDRMTYHRLAQKVLPECSIVPIGSVENVRALARLSNDLDRAVFGLEFFLIRDRDGLTDDQIATLETNNRARCLKRRHVENYYLDADVLADVARKFYLPEEWHQPHAIRNALQKIAKENIDLAVVASIKEFVTVNGTLDAPTCKNLQRKQGQEIRKEITELLAAGIGELQQLFSKESIDQYYERQVSQLNTAIDDGDWEKVFPGKLLFGIFCGRCFKQDAARIRQAYLDLVTESHPHAMEEITEIMEHFARIAGLHNEPTL